MGKFNFNINGKTYVFSGQGSPEFKYGKEEVLSGQKTDIAFGQPWYQKGYKAIPFLSASDFKNLKEGLTDCIQRLINKELGMEVENFELNKYHKCITSNEDHFKIVSKTRDLFPEDFNFPLDEIISKFEKILGFGLTDTNPYLNKQLHIIIRINRPHSTDYNPPHKDIYEGVDREDSYIPQFINLWIPICGVTDNSSLPMAPSSHLLPESKILRTFEGGVISGNKYRVRMIKEWGGSNELTRAKVGYGEVLFFSLHLVHGLAINEEEDETRVSLEFRLFKRD